MGGVLNDNRLSGRGWGGDWGFLRRARAVVGQPVGQGFPVLDGTAALTPVPCFVVPAIDKIPAAVNGVGELAEQVETIRDNVIVRMNGEAGKPGSTAGRDPAATSEFGISRFSETRCVEQRSGED
jgi:hypothetical protein